jgi:hypothetical protein
MTRRWVEEVCSLLGLSEPRWQRATTRVQPWVDWLEDRSLLTLGSITTPEAFSPIAQLVAGTAGDMWFSRVNDLAISHVAANGTVEEFGLPSHLGQPTDLEVDPAGNL